MFYDASKPLHLEIDKSGIGLDAGLLQMWKGINSECDEVPNSAAIHPVLFVLIKFHHYCFTKEVFVITDHKPLVAMISKDVVTLAQQLQHIIMCILQYNMCILNKPSHDLYILDWL